MDTHQLPLLNAFLNGSALVFLLAGGIAIKRGKISLHRSCMVGALLASILFLVSYLSYHALHGSTPFEREGGIRTLYFGILLSHTILAVVNLPLILRTVQLAVRGDFERHRRWARITWPIWAYVSLTGVLIYMMLYRWFPGPGTA